VSDVTKSSAGQPAGSADANTGSLRDRQRQLREEMILDAAQKLISEQGYEGTNMDEIATTVGISKPTLYQHFSSKEEIAAQVIARTVRMGEEDLKNSEPSLPAIERLEYGLRRSLERRLTVWNAKLMLPNLPFELKRHGCFQEAQGRITAVIVRLIEEAKSEGDIDPHLSTPVVTQMTLALFRIDYETLLIKAALTPEVVIETVVQAVMNGIRPR
jgi:AcrR family transcriptional regulator